VGRAGEVDEVAGRLKRYRLVTVTGPGGVGKTRLVAEVARRVADRFADEVWLVDLASVQEPAVVAAAVAGSLALHLGPGLPVANSLLTVLARRQLLLVLDNCEHVLAAAGELCAALLPAADDVRILATSREPLGVAGEARYRLAPLGLPVPDSPAGISGSDAVALFCDRAKQADPRFVVGPESGPAVARIVEQLDGMPLAIELAAARVEALGLGQLADRLDDRLRLLTGTNRLAADRHRSLAATAEWSYQLLTEHERQVYRWLAVFPGAFTLEAAETVAGADAGLAVLHLVDCSLLGPPRTGPDGRARYRMLETLRDYGAGRLAEAGEQPGAAARLAGFALQVAEESAAELETSAGELASIRRLDAEDATVHQGLAWALENDQATALRLAIALAPWWFLRGRYAAGYALLGAAAGHAAKGGEAWCAAQLWLGRLAKVSGYAGGLAHFVAIRDVLSEHTPSPMLVEALAGCAECLANLDRVPEAAREARRALTLARELGYPAGEARALYWLAGTAHYAGDNQNSLAWWRQAQRIDPASLPGSLVRRCASGLAITLFEVGDLDGAKHQCADGLALAREAGALYDQADFLSLMVEPHLRSGQMAEAQANLREAIELVSRIGIYVVLIDCLDMCGHVCAQSRRWADAITAWAAHAACLQDSGAPDLPHDAQRRQEPLRKAKRALGPDRTRAAEERGAAMGLATATDYAVLLVTAEPQQVTATARDLPRLSARERELVTLVAQGRTDAQIGAQLYITVRTVSSHLDRIRDKTGCRRRADLTRLALQAGLV
jgi:predicted ATPase/DNA-binding CsgD family transcriptional regulator